MNRNSWTVDTSDISGSIQVKDVTTTYTPDLLWMPGNLCGPLMLIGNTLLLPFPPSGLGLSQDLETGCLKLAIVNFLGIQIFKGGPQYT